MGKETEEDRIKKLLGTYKKDWDHHEESDKEALVAKEINEGISKYQHKRLPPLSKKEVTQEKVLALLDAIANFDPVDIQDAKGALHLSKLTLEQRMCIKSVKIREEYDDGVKVGEIKEIQFWDKMSAIDKLGKFLNMFTDAPQITNNNVIIQERLSKARNRLKEVREKAQREHDDIELVGKS